MRRLDEDGLWPKPQWCSIVCPKCDRPAARLVYQAPEARYLHYSRTGAYWHTVILDKPLRAEKKGEVNGDSDDAAD